MLMNTSRQIGTFGFGLAVAGMIAGLVALSPTAPAEAKAGREVSHAGGRDAAGMTTPVNDDHRFRPVLAGSSGSSGGGCVGDVDGNGTVDFNDLLAVLADWGDCAGCPTDVDNDGVVGFADLLVVLGAWGPCS